MSKPLQAGLKHPRNKQYNKIHLSSSHLLFKESDCALSTSMLRLSSLSGSGHYRPPVLNTQLFYPGHRVSVLVIYRRTPKTKLFYMLFGINKAGFKLKIPKSLGRTYADTVIWLPVFARCRNEEEKTFPSSILGLFRLLLVLFFLPILFVFALTHFLSHCSYFVSQHLPSVDYMWQKVSAEAMETWTH